MMSIDDENASSSMTNFTADSQLNLSAASKAKSASNDKPVVIGIYGLPGCGKTFIMKNLKQQLGEKDFTFYEGSKMIATIVPGGLEAFQKLDEQEKVQWRQRAIDSIGKSCAESGKAAVVVGHFMFWLEEQEAGQTVYTQNDLDTFTHILYLEVPVEILSQRRLNDKQRHRPVTSVNHLRKWQEMEKTQLRSLCRRHEILFALIFPHPELLHKISTLLLDFKHHSEKHNLSQAEKRLEEVLKTDHGQLETMLVIDGDKTLAAMDTGMLFWKNIANSRGLDGEEDPLKTLFGSRLGYSYTAFRQATLLYEETAEDQEFDAICQDVASSVAIHAEFLSLLKLAAEQKHVGVVVVTCGLRCVWDKILEREGLSDTVKVIGGGRIADGFVVSADVKGALVKRLRGPHQSYVWAFGDSPLDLEMLSKADQAIVVVGDEQTRSKTMDEALSNAIDKDGLQARQAILPITATPRLDTIKLPLVQLTDREFIDSVFTHRPRITGLQVFDATKKNAAKLLMTPTRDAAVFGPALREAHRRVGWYLATEFVADMIGVEEYPIEHVQGNTTTGYRLLHERQTSIVALMRGGEPMALGLNDAFPNAMFLHANDPEDIKLHHLQGQGTLLLVDSVVNSGKTVVKFVQHVRNLHATIRIVVVAGVAQAQSLSEGSLAQALAHHPNVSLVALRLSDNKFTGRGTTDTGNRLFNTTHIP